jgi:glycosyltransferase involved in cell wall biosynthesis
MNILFWWDQKEYGGVDTQLLDLIQSWPSAKDKFIVIHNKNNQGAARIISELLENPNVKNDEFFSINDVKNWFLVALFEVPFFPIYFVILIIYAYIKLLKYREIDIFVVNNGSYPGAWSGLAALIASKLLRVPKRVLLIHHRASNFRLFFGLVERAIDLFVMNAANLVITVSNATRLSLVERRHFISEVKPIYIIHNGIATTPLHRGSGDIFSLRESFAIEVGVKLIGMVSRVQQYKGHEDLLLGFAVLPEEIKKQFHIVFIGSVSGSYVEYLKSVTKFLGLNNYVTYTGYLPTKSRDLICQLDILCVLTRDFEGFGLTIAEAMSSGVPVIATKVGGVVEFANPECALLIPPALPSAVTEALMEYSSCPEIFLSRANNGKKQIQKFTASKMAFEYYRLFSLENEMK